MARSHGDPIGTIGSTSVRLADWRPVNEAYQRRYVPVKPQDRFVSGQQFEFTADLEFRDWVIDDFSGGVTRDEWWEPGSANVRAMLQMWLQDGRVGLARDREVTQQSSADFNGGRLFVANGELWSGEDDTIYRWDVAGNWEASGVSTGFAANDFITTTAMPVEDELYLANSVDNEIRKISDLGGTPSNAVHYAASGTGDDFTYRPVLGAFNGRVFALDGAQLYELDQSTADTRTLVSDLSGQSVEARVISARHAKFTGRLAPTDVGLAWWVIGVDGYTYIYEYNVAADTTDRVARIPSLSNFPVSVFWALGFVFVSFIETSGPLASGVGPDGRGFVFYFRGAQSGVIGPIPDEDNGWINDSDEYEYGSSHAPVIGGLLGDDLLVMMRDKVAAYNLTRGSWSQFSPDPGNSSGVANQGDLPSASLVVYGRDVFQAVVDDGGGTNIYRYAHGTQRTSTTTGHISTGRWHFGYPNVEKIFTTVTINTNTITADDDINLQYSVDGGAWTAATGTYSGSDNQFTWTLSDNSATVSGKDLALRVLVADRSATNTNLVYIDRLMARATSSQSRREWQLVLDASDSASAGLEQNDVAWLQELEDLKTNKQIVSFTDPWQQYDDGTADTFDVIVEDVVTPAATHDSDDQREAIVVLREVGLV